MNSSRCRRMLSRRPTIFCTTVMQLGGPKICLGSFDPHTFTQDELARLFGDVALAFEPSIENGHTVSVSPIDTGGLVHEKR